MKKLTLTLSLVAALGLLTTACSDDDSKKDNNVTKKAVVENYAKIVYQNYKDALDDAAELETAINTFTTTPTQANFDAAKTKWKEARESYGTTEAFRFANGPIDNDIEYEAPEGLINAWPLDEAYIDYVNDTNSPDYQGGIINRPADYPTINKNLLVDLNEGEDEKSISTGYHAIEFLLWGQDLTAPAENKPGLRAFTDYTTATNADRRKAYLNAAADLLTDHLTYLVDEWKEGGDYRTKFLALPEDKALQNIYLGIVTLASSELPIERMSVALENGDQEDEHSCFSDNTHRDIALNLKGIINVYKGEYGNISGASLEDLVKKANKDQYDSTNTAINASTADIAAMRTPFDWAIVAGPTSTDGAKVKVAYLQIYSLSQELLGGATAIGVTVNGL
ncbi:imelysin family protein [Flavobacterium psychrotrophum]|uniref:imelysin family protein n=1 Tax=Flavobacterium psychrotrophum TaxID=2294119 RepID=UPI000E31235F|nr:imelysin family protein [Flavobacterium psychrotrophum]